MKQNSAENYEPVNVFLTPDKTPIAYQNKVQCLMSSGMTEAEARKLALEPIELELYYEVGRGLFAVESEAVESCEIRSPYSGEPLEEETESSDETSRGFRIIISEGTSAVDVAFQINSTVIGMVKKQLLSWIHQYGDSAQFPLRSDGDNFCLSVLGEEYSDFYFHTITLKDDIFHFTGVNEDGYEVSLDETELSDNGLLYICDFLINGYY